MAENEFDPAPAPNEITDEEYYANQLEFQDEYPTANEPFGRYEWEK